jgi:hypothetical protein
MNPKGTSELTETILLKKGKRKKNGSAMNNRANYFTDGSRAIMDIHSLAHIFSSHT